MMYCTKSDKTEGEWNVMVTTEDFDSAFDAIAVTTCPQKILLFAYLLCHCNHFGKTICLFDWLVDWFDLIWFVLKRSGVLQLLYQGSKEAIKK